MELKKEKQISDRKHVELARLLLPLAICFLFLITATYLALYHPGDDPRTRVNKQLREDYPETELIAPTDPPKRWDEARDRWEHPEGDIAEEEKQVRLPYELEELRRKLAEAKSVLKRKR